MTADQSLTFDDGKVWFQRGTAGCGNSLEVWKAAPPARTGI